MFQSHQLSAGRFTAEREPLSDTQGYEEDRGCHADARVGRKQTDQNGCQSHNGDGSQEQVPPAELVAEVTADDRSQRSCTKPHAECGKGSKEGGGWVHSWEEQLRQHRGRHRSIKGEIEPLQGGANHGGSDGSGGHALAAGSAKGHLDHSIPPNVEPADWKPLATCCELPFQGSYD